MIAAPGLSSAHISPQVLEEYDEAKRKNWLRVVPTWQSRSLQVTQADSIRWAEGGDVVMLKTASLLSKPPLGGGDRDSIKEFSEASRRRLLRFVNSIDRRQIAPERLWFLTLTYPAVWPADPQTWKKHLQAFQKRLTRAWGRLAAIWKLEPQRRGAPHFHLILLVSPSMARGLSITGKERRGARIVTHWKGGELASFRSWLSDAWYKVVKSGDPKHLLAGTNCEPLEAWGKVVAYAAKYLGKECAFIAEDGQQTKAVGRYWGVWRREQFPVKWCGALVSFQSWSMVRRCIRRYCESKGWKMGHLRGRAKSATVFVPWCELERLIRYYVKPQSGSVFDGMRSAGHGDGINAWLSRGEPDRQLYHRLQRWNLGHVGPE